MDQIPYSSLSSDDGNNRFPKRCGLEETGTMDSVQDNSKRDSAISLSCILLMSVKASLISNPFS
jgi:hypothetical protein